MFPASISIAGDMQTHLTLDPNAGATRAGGARVRITGTAISRMTPTMHAALVLSGAGIAAGRNIGHVRNVDVAPTIARLLGCRTAAGDRPRAD